MVSAHPPPSPHTVHEPTPVTSGLPVILKVLSLLHHDMHVHKERVEPKMEHLLLSSQPLVVEELDLDISAQGHWLRKAELSKCIRPTDVLIHS